MKSASILLTAIIFTSCHTYSHLHRSGIYTVKDRNDNVTEFYEVRGKYIVISDTLKKNDKIVINVLKTIPSRRSDKSANDIVKIY